VFPLPVWSILHGMPRPGHIRSWVLWRLVRSLFILSGVNYGNLGSWALVPFCVSEVLRRDGGRAPRAKSSTPKRLDKRTSDTRTSGEPRDSSVSPICPPSVPCPPVSTSPLAAGRTGASLTVSPCPTSHQETEPLSRKTGTHLLIRR
jgi:hypothetical protein